MGTAADAIRKCEEKGGGMKKLFLGLYKNLWVKSSNNEGILCYGKPSF